MITKNQVSTRRGANLKTGVKMDATGLEGAKRTLFIALAVDMAVTFALVIFYYWAVGILEGVRAGTAVASPSTVATFDFWQKFASLTFLTVIGVGVALVRWLGTAYQYARETLGATGFAQEKWKVWGWIVPFLNTFKPFQVLSEIYKAGTSASVGDDWKKSSGSGWLLMWWVFWVLAHIVLMQIFIGAPKSGQSELDLSQSIAALNGGVLACVISLIVSGLWYIVAGSLSSRLLNRSVEFSGAATASGDVDFVDTKPNGSIPVMATRTAVDEDAVYAQIAQELETDTVDKGLWTRLLAQADGDKERTKVLYIKQRAERLLGSKEASAPVAKRRPPVAATPPATGMSAPARAMTIFGGVVGLGIVLAIVLPAYQDRTKRAATSEYDKYDSTRFKPFYGKTDDEIAQAQTSSQAKPSQTIEEFLKDAPNAPTAKPNFYSNGWTQESAGSTEVGPWLTYDPPGTRYWRDANRIIYRVFPPGTRPNSEAANPFGLDTSENRPQ